jgi:N utilization substance protein A
VLVGDDQLSLAIGRRGQNARLAAKLVGWKVDIKSRSELAREAEEKELRARVRLEELASVSGIGPKIAGRLVEAGFDTLDRLMQMSVEDLKTVEGIGPKTAAKIVTAVQEISTRPAPEVKPSAGSADDVSHDEEAVEPEIA